MKGLAAVWIGGATAVLVTSSTAVAMQSSRKNDNFREDVALSFRKHWNNRRVNRDATRYPIFRITKGSCFASFFPEVDLPHRPINLLAKNAALDTFVPTNFQLGSPGHQVGCKLMKMSLTTDKVAFGYMAETVVRSNGYGLALYSAATNLMESDKTSFEYWMLFMENKPETGWTIIGQFRWNGVFQSSTRTQAPFTVKTPKGKEVWHWNYDDKNKTTIQNLMSSSATDTYEKWQQPDKDHFFSQLWFGGDTTGPVQDTLFYDGSNERWAMRQQLGATDKHPIPFITKLHLTQPGTWKDLQQHCESHYALSRSSLPDWERNICFSQSKSK